MTQNDRRRSFHASHLYVQSTVQIAPPPPQDQGYLAAGVSGHLLCSWSDGSVWSELKTHTYMLAEVLNLWLSSLYLQHSSYKRNQRILHVYFIATYLCSTCTTLLHSGPSIPQCSAASCSPAASCSAPVHTQIVVTCSANTCPHAACHTNRQDVVLS